LWADSPLSATNGFREGAIAELNVRPAEILVGALVFTNMLGLIGEDFCIFW
jgi:hypothetical protein